MRSLLAVTSSVLLIMAFAASVVEAQSSTTPDKFKLNASDSLRFQKHIDEIKNLMLNHSNEYYIVSTEFKTANPEMLLAEGEVPGNTLKTEQTLLQKNLMNEKLNEMKNKLEGLAIAKAGTGSRRRRFSDDVAALDEAEELLARAKMLKFFADNFDFSIEITPN